MHSGAVCSDSSVSVSNRSSYTFFQYDKKFTTQHLFFCKAGRELPPFIRWWLAFTHPSLSSIFFHKFPIVVIVEGGVAINSLLLAQVMILIFGTVHRSVGDLQCKRSAWGSRIPSKTPRSGCCCSLYILLGETHVFCQEHSRGVLSRSPVHWAVPGGKQAACAQLACFHLLFFFFPYVFFFCLCFKAGAVCRHSH